MSNGCNKGNLLNFMYMCPCMQLYVRRHYFFPPSRITHYYEVVTSQVRAETQVRLHAADASASHPF